MTIFKQEKTYLTINNTLPHGKMHHIEAMVIYSYEQDDQAADFDYDSKEENDKEMARFNSGELLNLLLKVDVICHGFSESEYLGQCFVKASSLDADLLNIAAEHDLKNQASIALISTMKGTYNTLKQYFE